MDLAVSEALARIRAWETKRARVTVLVLSSSSLMLVELAGRVTVTKGVITMMGDSFQLRLSLTPTMTFQYADATLKVIASGWGCCLYETKV